MAKSKNQDEPEFLQKLAAPARRALMNNGIKTLKKLSTYSEDSLLALHGMGPSSIPKLKAALKSAGMALKGKTGGKAEFKINNNKAIDEYIAKQPAALRPKLLRLRNIILKNAPGAEERLSWGMASYYYHGMLANFAVFKKHYSLFLRPLILIRYNELLKDYKTTKAAINIPLDQELPQKLATMLLKESVAENRKKG